MMTVLIMAASLMAAPLGNEDPLPASLAAQYSVPSRSAFDAWLAEDVTRQSAYDDFEHLLDRERVSDVVEPWTLWCQGSEWKETGHTQFAVPQRDQWTAIVPTLRLVRDRVVPVVGSVRVVSGFRTPQYNSDAKGAKLSSHLGFGAVDLVPVRPWTREDLHAALLRAHEDAPEAEKMGLGLYSGVRFHIDSRRKRRW